MTGLTRINPRDPAETRGKSRSLITAAVLLSTLHSGPSVEQTSQGTRPPVPIVASFDGLGVGFTSLQPTTDGRNPSDNSLAVGPNHIVQIVNSRFVVFTKKGAMFDTTGKLIYGAMPTNTLASTRPIQLNFSDSNLSERSLIFSTTLRTAGRVASTVSCP